MKEVRMDRLLDQLAQAAPDLIWYHGLNEEYFSLKGYSFRTDRNEVAKGLELAYYLIQAHQGVPAETIQVELPPDWPKYDFTVKCSRTGVYHLYVSGNPEPERFPTSFQLVERLNPDWAFLRIYHPELNDHLDINITEFRALTAQRNLTQYLYEVFLPTLKQAQGRASVVFDPHYRAWNFYLRCPQWSYEEFMDRLTQQEEALSKTRPEELRLLARG